MKISVKPLAAIIGGSIGIIGGIGTYLSHSTKKAHKLFYKNLHVQIYHKDHFEEIISKSNNDIITLFIFANNTYLVEKISNALKSLGVSKKNIHVIDKEHITTEISNPCILMSQAEVIPATKGSEKVNYNAAIFFKDIVLDNFIWFYKDLKKSIKNEMRKA